MKELRFYTFVNFYLSSIQQGVQSFHVCHEMFNKYDLGDLKHKQRLFDWSKNHKTVIVLNGGANSDIEDKYFKLEELSKSLKFPMPFVKFNEDEKSLGGIVTACGCVLPEEIYDAVDYRKSGLDSLADDEERNSFFFIKDGKITQHRPGCTEHELITMLKSCPLAR